MNKIDGQEVKIHDDIKALYGELEKHNIQHRVVRHDKENTICVAIPTPYDNNTVYLYYSYSYSSKGRQGRAMRLNYIQINNSDNEMTNCTTKVGKNRTETTIEVVPNAMLFIKSRLDALDRVEITLWTIALSDDVLEWNGSIDLGTSLMYKKQGGTA